MRCTRRRNVDLVPPNEMYGELMIYPSRGLRMVPSTRPHEEILAQRPFVATVPTVSYINIVFSLYQKKKHRLQSSLGG
uniref:Uncharacterized protein n=1 Tax=Setaria viridis TaxID=4556 RepID=A0A4V6DCX6_SETVI|nr:hypothetical protein SEVIR_3G231500v2 [Setaria viridis]TKW27047.1 hypothetical protein SEVIR_3G231500v2 [Setaria viridis]